MKDNLVEWVEKAVKLLDIYNGPHCNNDPDSWDWWGWIKEAIILLSQEVRFWEDELDD